MTETHYFCDTNGEELGQHYISADAERHFCSYWLACFSVAGVPCQGWGLFKFGKPRNLLDVTIRKRKESEGSLFHPNSKYFRAEWRGFMGPLPYLLFLRGNARPPLVKDIRQVEVREAPNRSYLPLPIGPRSSAGARALTPVPRDW